MKSVQCHAQRHIVIPQLGENAGHNLSTGGDLGVGGLGDRWVRIFVLQYIEWPLEESAHRHFASPVSNSYNTSTVLRQEDPKTVTLIPNGD